MYVYVQYEGPPYFRTPSTCIIRVCSPAAYYGSIYTLYFRCMLDEGTRTVISSKVLSYESTSVFTCACSCTSGSTNATIHMIARYYGYMYCSTLAYIASVSLYSTCTE